MHFATTHTTASSFNSIVAYRDSTFERNHDPAYTGVQSSTDVCCRMNLAPCLLDSIVKCVGLVMSKKDRTGGIVRDSVMLENASS